MAEDDFKDISELKKQFEGMKSSKEISNKELYEAVQKLANTMGDMLGMFSAAADQMRLEEREYEAEARKHEAIIAKLDKIIDNNKTIAEGMVAIVEMVKEKIVAPAKEESIFRRQEPRPFMKPQQQWPRPEIKPQPIAQPTQQPMPIMQPQPIPSSDFGMQLPPLQPTPPLDFDFPEGLDLDEPKKKSLFGMFKK